MSRKTSAPAAALCTEKCPQKKVPNEFNLGMDNRRAIYIPFAQAVPKVATIDPDYCIDAQDRQVRRVLQGLHRRRHRLQAEG